ncbi:MAG: four helix bundle protein [Pirellulales bacterium]
MALDCVAFSYHIAKALSGVKRPARDQWLRAAQSNPLNIAEGNGKQASKSKSDISKLPVARRWNVRRLMMC